MQQRITTLENLHARVQQLRIVGAASLKDQKKSLNPVGST
jgi:hypothetical protein